MATKVKTTRTHGTALLACKNHPHLRWRQTKYVLEGRPSPYMGRGVLLFDGDLDTGKQAAPFSVHTESSLALHEETYRVWYREFYAVECDCSTNDLEFFGVVGMINVIQTTSGNFNVVGGNEHEFFLQGNLSVLELMELIEKATAALQEANLPPAGVSKPAPLTADEIISEDWLGANLPEGWSYDCTMTPEMAFLIGPGVGTDFVMPPFRLPCRLLKNVGD